jgi:hypothetical protein
MFRSHCPSSARFADKPEDFAKLGIQPGRIEGFDGMRTAMEIGGCHRFGVRWMSPFRRPRVPPGIVLLRPTFLATRTRFLTARDRFAYFVV